MQTQAASSPWLETRGHDGIAALSHHEEDDCGCCVTDEHPLISCADLDALASVSIGSNHHPNPKFLSMSALWQSPPAPATTALPLVLLIWWRAFTGVALNAVLLADWL